jgi:hypothetical protein
MGPTEGVTGEPVALFIWVIPVFVFQGNARSVLWMIRLR